MLCSQAFSSKFFTINIWSVVDFPCLNPAWYSPIIWLVYFLSLLLITVVNILYHVHRRDIPLQFLHCSLSPLFLSIGTMIFVFQSVGIFCSFHIPFIRLCILFHSNPPPFLQRSAGMLSMPGDLLLRMDCIAISIPSMSGGSSSGSSLVVAWFAWVFPGGISPLSRQ